jgi:hypothetical protein
MAMSNLDSPQVIKTVFDDVHSALKVVAVAGNFNVEITANSFSHIASNATTLVKSGAGVLTAIVVNTSGASSNIATIYDSLTGSGTVIAILDTTSKGTYNYNVAFSNGLTVVTTTGTAGDLTVTYT